MVGNMPNVAYRSVNHEDLREHPGFNSLPEVDQIGSWEQIRVSPEVFPFIRQVRRKFDQNFRFKRSNRAKNALRERFFTFCRQNISFFFNCCSLLMPRVRHWIGLRLDFHFSSKK